MKYLILITACIQLCACGITKSVTYSNGYIKNRDGELIGNYANGHIFDKERNIIGYYSNGFIYDADHRIIGCYRYGFVSLDKKK